MIERNELLRELRAAVNSGSISRRDVDDVFKGSLDESHNVVELSKKQQPVVQNLFYIAGIILFAAVLSVISQTWAGGTALHILLTVVTGSLIWAVAYVIGRHKDASEVSRGMADALLLTGSLLIITGGYIITNLFGGYGSVDFFQAAPTLFALAAVHVGFYYFARRDLLYVLAVLLGVASVGAVIFGILSDANVSGDAWAIAFIGLAGLLSWATHITTRLYKTTQHLTGAYDRPVIVVVLIAMYIASFGELSALWYLVLSAAIIGVFYLSIIIKQKVLLGTASVFLVLMTITIAFRYFSEFGVTTSLILSALAILGVAVLALQLSKKYLS